MPHGSKPSQPFGAEATGKLRSLVGGIGHEVIVMPIEKDRYGRTVAEVFVKKTNSQEETFVNGELVSLLLHKITFENVLLQSTSTDQYSGHFFERFHKAFRVYGSRIELFFQS